MKKRLRKKREVLFRDDDSKLLYNLKDCSWGYIGIATPGRVIHVWSEPDPEIRFYRKGTVWYEENDMYPDMPDYRVGSVHGLINLIRHYVKRTYRGMDITMYFNGPTWCGYYVTSLS